MKNFACVLGVLAGGVAGHSWPDNIGGGSYRGAQSGTDAGRERYFCPLSSLDACQPGGRHGITLTADSMKPCRTDYPTAPMGSAVAGQPMYIHWAGNGHTPGEQSGPTCVKVAIAPYALDPPMSSFTTIAPCLPFVHGNEKTDGYVTIPANLPAGKYTIFWLWDFTPFWFSGCGDINVAGGAQVTTTRAPVTTLKALTSSAPANTVRPATTVRPVTSVKAASTTDCRDFLKPNTQCQALHGASSYCLSWELDSCGKARCAGAPAVPGCTGPTTLIGGA